MKINLTKAIKHKGEELHTLDIPLEDLTGNDLIEVEEQITQSGKAVIVMDFSRSYLIAVAAKAAKIPVEALRMMNAHDFTRVTTEVRTFLLASGSEEEQNEAEDQKLPAA